MIDECALSLTFEKARSMAPLNVDTDRVVVLSGPPRTAGAIVLSQETPENVARIWKGIWAIRRIAALRLGPDLHRLESCDWRKGPILLLNGDTPQLPMMVRVARAAGFPTNRIETVNCSRSDGAIGNTKTQMEKLCDHGEFRKGSHLTFITTDYHVPRVRGTAHKQLPARIAFDIVPVLIDEYPEERSWDELVRGEKERIRKYVTSGDITDPTTL